MEQPQVLANILPKLRILKPKPSEEKTISTAAYQTTRVTAMDNGINLNRQDGGIIRYTDMSLLVVFQLDIDPDTWYVDMFVYGQPLPFRISQKTVNYRQFLPQVTQRSKDNFYAFVLFLIEQSDSVYVDERTLEFLKTRKINSFPEFRFLEEYTKQLWHQILSWMKFQCDQCGEVYWVDETKVTAQGSKTKCVKCQQIITVKKREKPAPLKAAEQQEKVRCPSCQYENPKGSQFCIMCQQPLTTFAPPKAKPAQIVEESDLPEPTKNPVSMPTVDLSNLPLQAREQWKPNRSLRELDAAMQEDINTLDNKFAWFSQFSNIMQWLAFLCLIGGILGGVYIYFVLPDPPAPEPMFTGSQRMTYAGISAGIGFLLSLASLIVSNIIALTLEIERNTKVTMLLMQRFLSKRD